MDYFQGERLLVRGCFFRHCFPYHVTVAEDSHVSATITEGRSRQTALSSTVTYEYIRRALTRFPSL